MSADRGRGRKRKAAVVVAVNVVKNVVKKVVKKAVNTRRIPVMLEMLRKKEYSVTTERPSEGIIVSIRDEPDDETRDIIDDFQRSNLFVFKR